MDLDADCRAPLRRYTAMANSDFHKPKHLSSRKTLVKPEKNWTAIKTAPRRNVDVALTLFRKRDRAVRAVTRSRRAET